MAQGIIKAMGYQKYATYICLVGYWIISIPLAYVFAFTLKIGVRGIWMGSPIGLFCVSSAFLYLIYSADFEELSRKISDRILEENKGRKDA